MGDGAGDRRLAASPTPTSACQGRAGSLLMPTHWETYPSCIGTVDCGGLGVPPREEGGHTRSGPVVSRGSNSRPDMEASWAKGGLG